MITEFNEITIAVLAKHGPLHLSIDKTGRFELSRINDPKGKKACAFTLGSCLIMMLAEDKL